jgi:alcohol dehydrogenase (NADP+)
LDWFENRKLDEGIFMSTAKAFLANSAKSPLVGGSIPRREVGANDVEFDILFCGVCHSDLHTARNEWAVWPTVYPCVPGHEIVGRVTKVGGKVKGFKPGDLAATGCIVDSCGKCGSCKEGLEQYCDVGGTIFTYNCPDPHKTAPVTYGGYSQRIVVDEKFVLRVSEKLDLAAVAPLLCAGITLYSPLKHWKAGRGKKVGIVGLGGLGHMGVKFAHAFGAKTVLFTTSPSKIEDGKRLGADEVVVSKNADQMKEHTRSFDLIVNTVAVSHDLDPFISLLKRDGTMVLVGAPEHPHPSPSVFNLLMGRRSLAGSGIGGIAETQEMLDYCAANNIVSDIEMIPMGKINEAYERMLKGDVKYRFVIDMKTL